MTDRRALRLLSDDDLGAALVTLGAELAVPQPAPGPDDPARRARRRIESATGRQGDRGGWRLLRRRSLRRSIVLALAALLVLAALAAAVGFGVPGIRIVFGPISPSAGATPSASLTASAGSAMPPASAAGLPSASPALPLRPPASGGLLGEGLGLGVPFAVSDAPAVAGLTLRLPPDPPYGPPAAAWLFENRVSLVWPASDRLPELREPGIGLILAEFPGTVDPGFFKKILGSGTEITAILVGDRLGWWISGAPHELIFVGPDGEPVFDTHRIVGDTLLWSDGVTTYRLESDLGRDGAVRLAESLR